jgi:hypothetical protein
MVMMAMNVLSPFGQKRWDISSFDGSLASAKAPRADTQ